MAALVLQNQDRPNPNQTTQLFTKGLETYLSSISSSMQAHMCACMHYCTAVSLRPVFTKCKFQASLGYSTFVSNAPLSSTKTEKNQRLERWLSS